LRICKYEEKSIRSNRKRNCCLPLVTKAEHRTGILAARKLPQFDGGKRVPATLSAIADAVRRAEEIMKAIDETLARWSQAAAA
jgi:hypothetical protein